MRPQFFEAASQRSKRFSASHVRDFLMLVNYGIMLFGSVNKNFEPGLVPDAKGSLLKEIRGREIRKKFQCLRCCIIYFCMEINSP
jgi:hypothetical protein